MKILITGGAGFIGSNFIRHILEKYPDVAVLNFDKLTYAGDRDNLRDFSRDRRHEFIEGDVADRPLVAEVLARFRPEYVLHLAAETHVGRSMDPDYDVPDNFIHSNIVGTQSVLEALRSYGGTKRYLQVSTYEVYGSLALDSQEKFHEHTPLNPENTYAVSKASADLLCHAYRRQFGLPSVVVRLSNVFGPFQYPENLVPRSLVRLLSGKNALLHGSGRQVRDWIFVADVCTALERCLTGGKLGGIYHVGAGNERSNLEVVRALLRVLHLDESRVEFVSDRPGNDERHALASEKIKKELGWEPAHRFEEGIVRTVEWYVENKAWIKKSLAREIAPAQNE